MEIESEAVKTYDLFRNVRRSNHGLSSASGCWTEKKSSSYVRNCTFNGRGGLSHGLLCVTHYTFVNVALSGWSFLTSTCRASQRVYKNI
jgi:hypothetical protein